MNWNIFKKKQETRSEGINYINPNLNTSVINFSELYSNTSAMNISAVYRATEIISDACGILPIKVVNNDNAEINNNIALLLREHYLLIKMMIQSVLLKGNGFAYIYRAADGKPIRLRFIENKDVQINYNKNKDELYYTCSLVSNKKIMPSEMIHLVKNTYDGVNGVSILSYASRAIGISDATENSAKNYFANGGHLTGILCAEGNTTAEQRQDAKNAFINNLKAGDISVLPKEFKYQSIQMNIEDAQLIESRMFNVQDIARFFGISPVLLGDLSHTSYNTIEATQQQFLIQTLQPYIIMIEEEFTKKLCTGGQKINMVESFILRTDKAAQAEYYSKLASSGILSVNEIRKELGFNTVEGGDKLIIAYTSIEDNTINTDEKTTDKTEEETN